MAAVAAMMLLPSTGEAPLGDSTAGTDPSGVLTAAAAPQLPTPPAATAMPLHPLQACSAGGGRGGPAVRAKNEP
eukprot:11165225-Lingulodinium_polyedra.AAC.1